jgi:uncharacterized protein YigE (DUF2233 family)
VKTLLIKGWIATTLLLSNASAVEFSSVEVAGKRVTICRVNVRKEKLQMFHRDETGQPFKRFDRLAAWLRPRGQKLVFAMNGGMYHDDFSPVGLLVSEGKQLSPLNLTNGLGNFYLKPNGVFLVSEAGALVIESSQYPRLRERAVIATQSGPLLVQGGRIHSALKPDSQNQYIRNGVGVPSQDVAVFAISDVPVNFHEFATMFRDVLKCPDALYLDGAVSSLYSTNLQTQTKRRPMDLGPIIAITE